MGADRARVAVLVGHDLESLEPAVTEQSPYRFGLVAAQLQKHPATWAQPARAPSHDLSQEVSAVGPTIEREPWLERQDVSREQAERVRRDVRHNGRQHVD